MWLDKLRELRKTSGITNKFIAEKMHKSERTIGRYFTGEADIRIDDLRDLVSIMGGCLDDILNESDFKLPTPEIEALRREIDSLSSVENELRAELVMLKDKVCTLEAENDRLRLTLAHKEEIISLHNYYNKLKQNV